MFAAEIGGRAKSIHIALRWKSHERNHFDQVLFAEGPHIEKRRNTYSCTNQNRGCLTKDEAARQRPPEHDSFLNAFDIRTIRTSARRICPASVRSRSRSAATVRKRAANERQTGGESDASAALNAGDRSDVPAPTPVAVRAADTPSDARSGGFSGRNVGPSAPWAGNGAEGPMEHEASRRQMSRKLLPSMERISAPSLTGSMGLAT